MVAKKTKGITRARRYVLGEKAKEKGNGSKRAMWSVETPCKSGLSSVALRDLGSLFVAPLSELLGREKLGDASTRRRDLLDVCRADPPRFIVASSTRFKSEEVRLSSQNSLLPRHDIHLFATQSPITCTNSPLFFLYFFYLFSSYLLSFCKTRSPRCQHLWQVYFFDGVCPICNLRICCFINSLFLS